MKIDTKGIDRAALLFELYQHARAQRLGCHKPGEVSYRIAAFLVGAMTSFTSLYGRILDVDIAFDQVDFKNYERAHGAGTAEKAVAAARLVPVPRRKRK